MIDEQISLATCQVLCGDESGTGWLIAPDTVLTAHHCIVQAIQNATQPITLRFGKGEVAVDHVATVLTHEEDIDVCLLRLPNALPYTPVTLETTLPVPGRRWYAFGYPIVKLEVGHRVEGQILQILDGRPVGMDIDLVVDSGSDLTDYRGFSGAAMICDHRCYGMLRVNVDKTLGAVSTVRMVNFLKANGLLEAETVSEGAHLPYAERDNFAQQFEMCIKEKGKGYLFLEGAPGIGKSTFCQEFRGTDDLLEHFGTYSFTGDRRGANATHRVQPEVFFDWLNTQLSIRSTGKPARLSDKNYAELISGTEAVLDLLARRATASGKVGLLFIDGLNEAAQVGGDALHRFIGLLPTALPSGLVIVLTGTSFENVAAILGNRARSADRITLPTLPRDAELDYCVRALVPGRATPMLVARICGRAKGHPLYLRYLIDFVNGGATEEELDELPPFSGSILEYYENIWAQILHDVEAINLLGIIARLRWGIPVSQLIKVLSSSEISVFVATFARIRHLLWRPEETAFYHASFAEFLVDKTRHLNTIIHARLADYCFENLESDYCVLNLIYHELRGGAAWEMRAIAHCNQDWVDRCVLLGAEPDVLLSDVENVLSSATRSGTATDVVRMLLLSHRLGFRYDTLFAQSAGSVAEAMIALGKMREALQHVVRYGHLIAPIDDIFRIALRLIQADENNIARDLLEKTDQNIMHRVMQMELELGEFIKFVHMRIHLLVLKKMVGREDGRHELPSFLSNVFGFIEENTKDFMADERKNIKRDIVSFMQASILCIQGDYLPLSSYPANIVEKDRNLALEILLGMLLYYRKFAWEYDLHTTSEVLRTVFVDIATLMAAVPSKPSVTFDVLETMVILGAPRDLVVELAAGEESSPSEPIPLVTADNVTVDLQEFAHAVGQWRLKAFLEPKLECPAVMDWTKSDWQAGLKQLVQTLAWCDGTARRALAEGDDETLREVWSLLGTRVLRPLRFSLQQRVSWDRSYAIPEAILPYLYEQLSELFVCCYPTELQSLLHSIDERFTDQCGMYSEGFCLMLRSVLRCLLNNDLETSVADLVFDLAVRWKNYLVRNIKNRHEVVPALLEMIPIFAKLQATEEAHLVYRTVLAVSMGPSWYKEDQLSLMISTLESFPASEPLAEGVLPRIAANLECASGEMTFQRFVRYDKAHLLKELCRRRQYVAAVRYFKHQTCGTLEELFAQANDGEMDKPSPMRGLRYPGGALDEQQALADMLTQVVPEASWQVCWALLEVYQQGDARHLERWGAAYAKLVARDGANSQSLAFMVERMNVIVSTGLNVQQRGRMLNAFYDHLAPEYHPAFSSLFEYRDFKSSVSRTRASVGQAPSPPTTGVGAESLEADQEANDSQEDDMLLIPGLFGKRSSISDAEAAFGRAQYQLKRRNVEKAKSEAVRALQILQQGKWSIWQKNSTSIVGLAGNFLYNNVADAESLVRLYGPLLLEERHVSKWMIASHLIERMAGLLSATDRASITDVVLEHVMRIVGDNPEQAQPFSYMRMCQESSATEELLELLLWLLDHPSWERRDGAAALVLWLMETWDDCLPTMLVQAFSMHCGYRADVLCGALDILSREQPLAFWNRIVSLLNLDCIVTHCKHVGRIAVLLRIAKRAAEKGSVTASAVVSRLQSGLQRPGVSGQAGVTMSMPPSWGMLIEREWQDLDALGYATDKVTMRAEIILAEICNPLNIETAFQLEQILSKGFREHDSFTLGRWGAKVRYALNVALFPYVDTGNIEDLEKVFRIYNPEFLHRMQGTPFPTASLIDAIVREDIASFRPMNHTHIYLDYQEFAEINHKMVHIELSAFLIPPWQRPDLSSLEGTFISTELPHSETINVTGICSRVEPVPAYFGALTPAMPLQGFLQRTGASMSDTIRTHWRDQNSAMIRGKSRFYEGCLLAISRRALKLPPGWRMSWIVLMDKKMAGILDPL